MSVSTSFNLPQFTDEYDGLQMRQLVDELERLHAELTRLFDTTSDPFTYAQSTEEQTNNITPTDLSKLWGDALRYDVKVDNVTDDTAAWQRAVDSGHPVFCDKEGTSNLEGEIRLNGNKTMRLNANLAMERQSGGSTLPLISMYGNNNLLFTNGCVWRQDTYAHLDGIIHIGPDTFEIEGGPTDVQSNNNRIFGGFKIVGAVKFIPQDGSMGIYLHSIGRKVFPGDRWPTYDTIIGDGYNVVNCDVGVEFSTDASRSQFGSGFIHQWKKCAIQFNGAYGNQFFGLTLESPLAVTSTRRYALLFNSNNSGRETGTNPSFTGDGVNDVDFIDGGGGNDSIVRTTGSWIDDGFRNGDILSVLNSASNDGVDVYTINSAPTDTTLTVATASLTAESNVAATVSTREFGITQAFANVLNMYAELPSDVPGNKVVSLFDYDDVTPGDATHVQHDGGHNIMRGPLDSIGAGFGRDGKTDKVGMGTNIVEGTEVFVDYYRIWKLHDYHIRKLDDDSGSIFQIESGVLFGGRQANMLELNHYDLFEVDDVGTTGAGIRIKLSWCYKESANSTAITGEAHWNCQVEGGNANAPIRYFFNVDEGGEVRGCQPVCQSAAGTAANTGKFTISVNNRAVPSTGSGFFSWWAEIMSSNLTATNLDWKADLHILTTEGAGDVGNEVIVGYWAPPPSSSFTLRAFDKLVITTPNYTGDGADDLDFIDGGGGNDSIVRTTGSWITDGFENGRPVAVSDSASNDGQYTIVSAPTATTLEVATASLVAETNVAATVSQLAIGLFPGTLMVGDKIIVHNASNSIAKVTIDPGSHSIKGAGATVTASDTMTIAPGETAHMVCVSTAAEGHPAVMEVV